MDKTYNDVKVSEIQSALGTFSGSERFYRHALNLNVIFSEGARFVAESCGAYWLVDEIALAQYNHKVKAEDFQVWKLVVTGSKAVLTMGDGNDHVMFRMPLQFTDFPLPEITLWFENGTIYLPSER